MHRALILGGGFGGIAAALALREQCAAETEIVLVDRQSHFMVGFRKTWALLGRTPLDAGRRPLTALKRRGIDVIQGTVTAIEPAARAAVVDGRRIEADALVVALGAELAPDLVPGFAEHALNVYDPTEIPRASEALQRLRQGRVLVGIFGVPYKCPPAPFELALLLHELFDEQQARVHIDVFTPLPMSIPLLGQASCSAIEGRLAARGIGLLPGHRATAVERGAVVFGDERQPFDRLLGVPPHRCPAVVVASGLAEGGWIRVDPRTMATRFPGVYAVGDVTEIAMANTMPLPKAGVFAEAGGRVAAAHIAATFAGRTTEAAFEGNGHCFMEVGNGEAVLIRGGFLAEPAPAVEITAPSRQYLDQKIAFEAERLKAWFGGE